MFYLIFVCATALGAFSQSAKFKKSQQLRILTIANLTLIPIWIAYSIFFTNNIKSVIGRPTYENQFRLDIFMNVPVIPLSVTCFILGAYSKIAIDRLKFKSEFLKLATFNFLISYLASIAWWNLAVEPRLDGSEGSGVGYGLVFVYIFLAVPFFITGLIMVVDIALRAINEFLETKS
jgi:hypothetical protein